MDKAASALKLRDDVAKQFEAVGKVRTFYSARLGRLVDLNEVTLAEAKALAEAGYLVRKEKSANSPSRAEK